VLQPAAETGLGANEHRTRAIALAGLGRHEAAIAAWTDVLKREPEDARAYLERAGSFSEIHAWDQAIADLERALSWSTHQPDLLARITLRYIRCLPARPGHAARVLGLVRSAFEALLFDPRTSVDPQSLAAR
jgi:tetratricopeptide (TPR) repeat protein